MRPIRPLLRLALAVALAGATLASCSSGERGAGSASCAAVIEYDGHTYWGAGGLKRDPVTTGRLVEGVLPICDDSGGQDPPEVAEEAVRVAELADVPLATGFLWNGSLYLRHRHRLPAATRIWFRAPRCTTAGEFTLTADWLGVTGGRKVRFDGDLRPPYRLQVHVTKGPNAYVGTTVALRADATTEPTLGANDVKDSLWEGGQVAARVRCADGRFRAVGLWIPPRS
jgi:hypothetical protein